MVVSAFFSYFILQIKSSLLTNEVIKLFSTNILCLSFFNFVAVAAGAAKAAGTWAKIFKLGIVSGAHIGFGSYLAITVGGACPGIAQTNPGLQKVRPRTLLVEDTLQRNINESSIFTLYFQIFYRLYSDLLVCHLV